MLVMPAAIGVFLAVNLLCACVALGLGFAAGVWFYGAHIARPAAAAAKREAAKQSAEARRAVERAAFASQRVVDLAQGVACDVGDHAARMKAITADLADAEPDDRAPEHDVLNDILAANSQLQQRLAVAEQQLAAQAAEIKVHESRARTDSLTGLANRRAFDDELKRRIDEWGRKRTPLALIMLDIDFFKRLNDTYGHQAGDGALRQVAATLHEQARQMDLPCRYGGEEFAIVLPATDTAGACTVAERIRSAVEEVVVPCDGKPVRVTCSLGVSEVRNGDDNLRLIRRADEALYRSKNSGRNCGHWNDGRHCYPLTTPVGATEDADPTVSTSAGSAADRTAAGPRTTFLQVLKQRVMESHRFGLPLSLACVAIDRYDSIAATYRRSVANQLVEAVGSSIERTLRDVDVLGKLDNGVFLVLMPGSTEAEAGRLIRQARIALANCAMPVRCGQVRIQLQHHVVQLQANETASELLRRAKHAGGRAVATGNDR